MSLGLILPRFPLLRYDDVDSMDVMKYDNLCETLDHYSLSGVLICNELKMYSEYQ